MSLSGNRPIAKKYKLGKELGKGSFGIVHLGTDITSGDEVAIKLERVKSKHPQLLYESRIYRALQGGEGVPSLKWFGTEASHNILIIDYLGPSLEDLFSAMHRKFTPLTVVMIGEQMVQRIEFMHSRHFIHRDIKPDNFLSGRGRKASTLYIIDFGLSKRYRHPKSKKHMAYREGKNLTGTPRYASINNHLGVEQSRRDDMESIGYVLIYFARGALPWQGLKANTKKQKYQKIMDKKMSVAIPALCNKVPVELKKYIEYCRSLRFEDKPNYPYLKTLFQEAARSGKYGDPSQGFDWLKGSPAKSGTSTGSNRAAPRPPRQNNVDPNVMRSSRFPDGKRGMMPGSARQNMSMNNVQSQVSNIPMNLPVPPSARISARKELANSGHYEDSFDHEYDH